MLEGVRSPWFPETLRDARVAGDQAAQVLGSCLSSHLSKMVAARGTLTEHHNKDVCS